jgi:DNA-binding transcriptional LysR family regulator
MHGTITVGTMQGLWPGLRRALLVMSEEHPDVIVELHQAPAAVMQEEVRSGKIDLAVVALAPQQELGLAARLLWQEPMLLVTGQADPLAGADPVSLSAVGSRPFVDFPDGWAVRREVDRAFRAAKAARGRRFQVNDLLSAADLVEYNLAVTILPRSLAQRFPRLLVRPLADHVPSWRVVLVRRPGELSEPMRTFLNLLR